ncbi:hypothetical protein PHMEG_00030549 [Phytophthora megakarya]|uniref:Uncharacterized protein n=1 Tax=Phytophthora megakarya TaxID=4795 RepID=A0A225V112_9STRA|nr:hypothetical protein PHMEG_00030549 [Phytophthora megakarya]
MYEFEMWIVDHIAGVDVVLETDFMIPACERLDLFRGIARLPGEVVVPLVKSTGVTDDEPYGAQVVRGPTEDFMSLEVSGERSDCPEKDHHVQCTSYEYEGPAKWDKPVWVRLTNVSDGIARCYKHSFVVYGYPEESSHARWGMSGSIRARRHETVLQKELYECWLEEQAPVVDKKACTSPERVLARPSEDSVAPRKSSRNHQGSVDRSDGENHRHSTKTCEDSEALVTAEFDEDTDGGPDTRQTELSDVGMKK